MQILIVGIKGLLLAFCGIIMACVANAQVVIEKLSMPMGPKAGHFTNCRSSISYQGGRVASGVVTVPTDYNGLFEDFSRNFGPTPDSNLWLLGGGVCINNTFGVRVPSFNVATFDGMRSNGRAYSDTLSLKGYCDSLTTTELDLSNSLPGSQSWVLRFRWQPGSSAPETIADTNSYLLLQLRSNSASDANEWRQLWKQKGTDSIAVDSFSTTRIEIPDSLVSNGVQFRWINYGQRNGWYDTWNLDYIQLAVNLDNEDTLSDITYTNTPTPLLRKYTHFPTSYWNAAARDYITDSLGAILRNNRPDDGLPITFNPAIEFLKEPRKTIITAVDPINIEGSFFFGANKRIRPVVVRYYNIPDTLFAKISETDSVSGITTRFSHIAQGRLNTIRYNDTITNTLYLGKKLAMDDGTAEATLYVDGPQAKGAMKFDAPVLDTLTAVQMYFPRLRPIPTVTNPISFTLKILRSLGGGIAGTRPRLDTVLYASQETVSYTNAVDSFTTFNLTNLSSPLIIRPGQFYICFQQISNVENQVRLGFDLNYPDSTPFYYNRSGTWEKFDSPNGVPMMRAIFGNRSVLSVRNNELKSSPIFLYPNPSSSRSGVILETQQAVSAQLFNGLGQVVQSFDLDKEAATHELKWNSNLTPNLYFLKVQHIDGLTQTMKVVIQE